MRCGATVVACTHTVERDVRSRLALVLVAGFAVVEAVAGFAAGSLALLADAAHMLSDSLALGLALFAAWLAQRPATPDRSFGWRRAEVLAALTNALVLVVLGGWIVWEAIGRLSDPPGVTGGWVLAAGVAGLLVNFAAARVLHGAGSGLNVRAAMLHVLADLASSVGVVAAGVVILATGWAYADPIAGLVIGLLVIASTFGVLRETVGVLLEAAPAGMDAREVGPRSPRRRESSASTTCISGRSPPAFRRSRRTCSSRPAPTVTRSAASSTSPARALPADAHDASGRARAGPD